MRELMTLSEVAAALRTPPETLRYWRHVGKGPASLKVGRRVLYAAEDVDAFIRSVAAPSGGTDRSRLAVGCPQCGELVETPVSVPLRDNYEVRRSGSFIHVTAWPKTLAWQTLDAPKTAQRIQVQVGHECR